ncbi:MAG: SUMF1/EgtB/PvdO family nonheme iron enzyme [Victivallaceae bacterium]
MKNYGGAVWSRVSLAAMKAENALSNGEWQTAVEAYEKALRDLPLAISNAKGGAELQRKKEEAEKLCESTLASAKKLYNSSRLLDKKDLRAREKCSAALKTVSDFMESSHYRYVNDSAKKRLTEFKNQAENHLKILYSGPLDGQPWTIPDFGMELVYVAPGSFMMGSNDGKSYEKPVHRVTISKGYCIGKYEVTQSEYRKIMGSNPSHFKGDNLPVEKVSWNNAVRFCERLTERERKAGRLPSNYEYRLPTEAEWEFVARGGNKSNGYKYSGSDNIDNIAWYGSNSGKETHEIGTKSPNELGIHDMSGNVWEWCLDDWHANYNGAPNNGNCWKSSDSGSTRVFRSGSWGDSVRCCVVTFRRNNSPARIHDNIGFRIVLAQKLDSNTGKVSNLKAGEHNVSSSKPSIPLSGQITPGLGMEFVYVAPGSFMMGSDSYSDEEPVHRVTISTGYWIGKYEVTQKEYRGIMGTNPSHFKGDNLPVENVSWNDAIRFCKKLTQQERKSGRLSDGYKYRLPTEAEWEFAARGGNKSKGYKYSGSDNIDSVAWYGSPLFGRTHNIGTKSGNELDIHDMSGNVLEWCNDWYGKYSSGSVTDPLGASSGTDRVGRGGSWYSFFAWICRSGYRHRFWPSYRFSFLGFRLVKAVSEKTASVKNTPISVEALLVKGQPWTIPGLGMRFVYVTPGSFMMGSNADYEAKKPAHNVTICKGFWIGKYEVTQKEYQSVMGTNPSYFKGSNKPVENVSWNDALLFCKKLTKQERIAGRLPSNYVYRIPTEAEWEFAACEGNKSHNYKYNGSDDINSVAWYSFNSGIMTHEIGSKSPNGVYIYDMSGNVCEWCYDWYDNYSSTSQTDPIGPLTGSYRVRRGGSWADDAGSCQVATRFCSPPNEMSALLGFRVVLAAPINDIDNTKKLDTEYKTYTVQKNDSFWKIARKHGVTMRELAYYNNVPLNKVLIVGEKLKIPPGGYVDQNVELVCTPEKPETPVRIEPEPRSIDSIYIVKAGDSFWKIAKKHGITIRALLEANNMIGKEVMMIGQKLKIPLEIIYEEYKVKVISKTGIPWSNREIKASIKLSDGKMVSTGFYKTDSNGKAVFKVKKTDMENAREVKLIPKDKYFVLLPVKSKGGNELIYVALPSKREIEITGKVANIKFEAIQGAEIKIYVEETFVKGTKTDSQGNYSIPLSDYKAGQKLTVKASHPDHLPSSITMFNFDSSLPVTFTLNPKQKQNSLKK